MTKPIRKDHGVAWLILAAAFFCHFIVFGTLLCFGIYIVTLVEYFNCHRTEAALVSSIALGTKCITGLISGVLFKKFGCRFVVICGGVLATLGNLLSYFATSIHHLYFSWGLIGGVGLGLVYAPSIGVLPDYFDKWRFFATAFVTVGSACGTLTFSPFFLYFINTYTWHGSMLINAGVTLQLVVLGALLKSQSYQPNATLASLINLSLFRDLKLYLLIANCMLFSTTIFVTFAMINNLVISRGLSKADSAMVVSCIGISNVCGRITSSFIGHHGFVNRVLFYGSAILLLSVGAYLMTVCFSFAAFAGVAVLFGFHYGAMLAQLPGVILEVFGVSALMNVLSYSLFALGFGAFSLTTFGSWLTEATGQVESSFYFCGTCGVVAGLCMFVVELLRRRENKQRIARMANDELINTAAVSNGTSAEGAGLVTSLVLLPSLENWEVLNSQRDPPDAVEL